MSTSTGNETRMFALLIGIDCYLPNKLNEQGQYEIWDPAGTVLQNLNPPLKSRDARAADTLVQRVIHLTKYRNVQELTNNSGRNLLSNKLVVELAGVRDVYDPENDPVPEMTQARKISMQSMRNNGSSCAYETITRMPLTLPSSICSPIGV
jgi:hypothetical protein